MVIQTREKNEKVIPSIKELALLGSVITHYGAGRFDLYRRIARECGAPSMHEFPVPNRNKKGI